MLLSCKELDSTESTRFELKVLQGILNFFYQGGINPFLGLAIVVVRASSATKWLVCRLATLDCLVNANVT